jgi:hypothetical protein
LFAQAIAFNRFVTEQRLMQSPNYLTGMSYLLITSLFKEWNILSSTLIINTLLIGVWSRMSRLYNKPDAQVVLFNIGLVIGICTFFYFPSIAFALLIVFGLAVTRPFRLSEWFITLIGIITPYYFLISLVFIFFTGWWKKYKLPGIAISLPKFFQSGWEMIAIVIVLLIALIGFYFVQQNMMRQLVQTRKSWNLIFIYLLVAIFIPFINATHAFQYWILCAVPLSVLAGCFFFYSGKKWVTLGLHWLLAVLVVAFNYFL